MYSIVLMSVLMAVDPCSPDAGNIAETMPAPVEHAQIVRDLLQLRTLDGRRVAENINSEFEAEIKKLFQVDPRKISKLEQFYGLLYFLAKYRTIKDVEVSFNPEDVYKLLLSSKVFSSPTIPKQVAGVQLKWNKQIERAAYDVKFHQPEVRLELNNGKGFSSFREGLCQTARELRFYGGFSFVIDLNKKDHIFASEFKNVDLFGTFGSRGVVDVDIQFVSLRSVEFLNGSPFGVVRAKVSKREFEVNEHSMLLQLVTSMVTDKSTQPIDW
jgi:hypothetical protein